MKKTIYTLLSASFLISSSMKAQVSKTCFKPAIVPNYTWTAASGGPFSGTTYGQVAAADFNNDGIMDIAAASNGVAFIEIKLGNNTGTFTPSQDISDNSLELKVTDVNNDGNKDIISLYNDANLSLYQIRTYLGNGNGTFGAAITSTTSVTGNINAIDINNDGNIDLAQILYTPTTRLVFRLGNGAGNFAAPSNTVAGISNTCFDDFNNDGFIDFIGTTGSGVNVSKYNGNGAGGFTLAGSYPANGAGLGTPSTAKSADLNADGLKDIVVLNGGASFNYCTSLLGTSTGSFSPFVNVVSGKISSVNIGNLNGDIYPDIACTFYGSAPSLTLYFNDGATTTFATVNQVLATSATLYREFTTLADFNQDGKLDLLAVKTGTAIAKERLNIYLQQPIPTLTITSSNNIICAGQSAVLTSATNGPHTLFLNGLFLGTGSTTVTINPTITTTYTVGAWGGPSSVNDICPFITDAVFTQTVSTCTGIDEVINNNLVSIYPNPASEILNVQLEMINDNTTISVINSLGEVVLIEKVISNNITLKTSNLTSGIYFIKVEGKNGSSTKKFIKQ